MPKHKTIFLLVALCLVSTFFVTQCAAGGLKGFFKSLKPSAKLKVPHLESSAKEVSMALRAFVEPLDRFNDNWSNTVTAVQESEFLFFLERTVDELLDSAHQLDATALEAVRKFEAESSAFRAAMENSSNKWANLVEGSVEKLALTVQDALVTADSASFLMCATALGCVALVGLLFSPRMSAALAVVVLLLAAYLLFIGLMHRDFMEMQVEYAMSTKELHNRLDKQEALIAQQETAMGDMRASGMDDVARIHDRLNAANDAIGQHSTEISRVRDAMSAMEFPATQCEFCVTITDWDGACGNGQCACGTFCTSLGQPSPLFHDDTDKRGGGCVYKNTLRCWQEPVPGRLGP